MSKLKRLGADEILERELVQGEEVLWVGQPNPLHLLSISDIFLIPFSLMWGGFAIFWEASVIFADAPLFFKLWGIPFVLVGQYLIWGRFVHRFLRRRNTFYAITDNRIISFNNLFGKNVRNFYIRNIPELSLSRNTVYFTARPPLFWGGRLNPWALWLGDTLDALHSIADAESVYQLLQERIHHLNR